MLAAFRSYVDHGAGHHTAMHWIPSFNDLNTGVADELDAQEMLKGNAAEVSAAPLARATSNKKDKDWPTFGPTIPDIHQRPVAHKRGDFLYDSPKDPQRSPSIMEFILKSEQVKSMMIEPKPKRTDAKAADQEPRPAAVIISAAPAVVVSASPAATEVAEPPVAVRTVQSHPIADVAGEGAPLLDEYHAYVEEYGGAPVS